MNKRGVCDRPDHDEARKLADRYRLLVEHSSDVVVRTSSTGLIEWVSPAVTRLLGWTPGQLIGRTPLEFTHVHDVHIAVDAHRRLTPGHTVEIASRLRTADGDHRWIGARISPIVIDGEVVGRVANWRDVSAEMAAVARLHRREELFRTRMDQVADLVVHTTDGVVTWLSSSVERLTGWRAAELIGTPSWQWIHEDDLAVMDHLRQRRGAYEPVATEFRMRCRDGSTRWFEVVTTSRLTDDGVAQAVSVLRDIDQRVVAEREQQAMEHRLAATLDTMFDPHSYLRPVLDDQGMVVDVVFEKVNEALCRYLRCERHQIEGRRVSEVLPRHMRGGIVDRVREVVQSGVPFVADGLRSWNDMLGEHRLYDITVIPVGEVLSMWHRDVTERLEQFKDEARLRSLEALQSERERLARDLHDGAIQKVFASSMQLAALAAQLPAPHRARLENLIELHDAVIRDLRTTVYQLGTTGRSTVSPERSLYDTVDEASRALGFAPRITVDGAITTLDSTTLGHLLLVLREALSNVARHAQATEVEVDVAVIGSEVILDVWDDGVGLLEQQRQGNGLTNMARRAQLLGGECRLLSPPDEGTELIWRVPIGAS